MCDSQIHEVCVSNSVHSWHQDVSDLWCYWYRCSLYEVIPMFPLTPSLLLWKWKINIKMEYLNYLW